MWLKLMEHGTPQAKPVLMLSTSISSSPVDQLDRPFQICCCNICIPSRMRCVVLLLVNLSDNLSCHTTMRRLNCPRLIKQQLSCHSHPSYQIVLRVETDFRARNGDPCEPECGTCECRDNCQLDYKALRTCIMELSHFEHARLPHGHIVMECDGGEELSVSPDILSLISPVLSEMIAVLARPKHTKTSDSREQAYLKVHDTTAKQWQLVLKQVYPAVNRPQLTTCEVSNVLPLVHKYNIEVVLSHIHDRVTAELPGSFPLDPKSDKYLFKWLRVAEELQLDKLKDACIKALEKPLVPDFKVQVKAGHLDPDFKALRHDTLIEVIKAMAKRSEQCECGVKCMCGYSSSYTPTKAYCHTCKRARVKCNNCGHRRVQS